MQYYPKDALKCIKIEMATILIYMCLCWCETLMREPEANISWLGICFERFRARWYMIEKDDSLITGATFILRWSCLWLDAKKSILDYLVILILPAVNQAIKFCFSYLYSNLLFLFHTATTQRQWNNQGLYQEK